MDHPAHRPQDPESLEQVRLEVSGAGHGEEDVPRPRPTSSYEFVWDRRDAYGREVQGRQPVTIKIGFVYGLRRYSSPGAFNAAFGKFSGFGGEVIGEARDEPSKFVSWRTMRDEFGIAVGSPRRPRAPASAAGSSTSHHAYDPRMRTLYRGDGPEISAEPALDTLAGTGHRRRPARHRRRPRRPRLDRQRARPTRSSASTRDGEPEVMAGSVGGGGAARTARASFDNATTERRPAGQGLPARPADVGPARPRTAASTSPTTWSTGAASSRASSTASTPAGRIDKIAGCPLQRAGG